MLCSLGRPADHRTVDVENGASAGVARGLSRYHYIYQLEKLRLRPFIVLNRRLSSPIQRSATGEDKKYDRVKFDNGYGEHRLSFTVSFKGYKIEENGVHKEYSNGMVVDTRGKRTFTILLGDDIVKKS